MSWHSIATDRIKKWLDKRAQQRRIKMERQLLLTELRQALQEWQNARTKMNGAESADQVDYAISYYEATLKRYEMLLRLAKKQQLRSRY